MTAREPPAKKQLIFHENSTSLLRIPHFCCESGLRVQLIQNILQYILVKHGIGSLSLLLYFTNYSVFSWLPKSKKIQQINALWHRRTWVPLLWTTPFQFSCFTPVNFLPIRVTFICLTSPYSTGTSVLARVPSRDKYVIVKYLSI